MEKITSTYAIYLLPTEKFGTELIMEQYKLYKVHEECSSMLSSDLYFIEYYSKLKGELVKNYFYKVKFKVIGNSKLARILYG